MSKGNYGIEFILAYISRGRVHKNWGALAASRSCDSGHRKLRDHVHRKHRKERKQEVG